MALLTSSATLTVFVPDRFWTTSVMFSTPLTREIVCRVLVLSLTVATSLEIDRVAAEVGHDDPVDLVDVLELGLGPDQEVVALLGDPAGRQVQVLGPDGLADLGQRKVEEGQLVDVDLDLDLALEAADDLDLADAVDPLDAGPDLVVDEPAQVDRVRAARCG